MPEVKILKGAHEQCCTAGKFCLVLLNTCLQFAGEECCCGYVVVDITNEKGKRVVRLKKEAELNYLDAV